MKTISELKRNANSGLFEGNLIYRYGEKIPERLQGWRKLVKANTVDIFFQNADGKLSAMQLPKKALIEYTDTNLTLYNRGFRALSDEEKKVMAEWDKFANTDEYQNQAYTDAMTDGSTTYWQKKNFFSANNMEHLLGYNWVRGEKLDFSKYHNGEELCIESDNVRGDKILEYEIRKGGAYKW